MSLSHIADDVEVASSAFTEFDMDERKEEDDAWNQFYEHEEKFTPTVVVKQEISEDVLNDSANVEVKQDEEFTATERNTTSYSIKNESIDDCLGEKSLASRRELRKRKCAQKKDADDLAEEEIQDDGEWIPEEDDDWASSKSKRRKTPSRKPTARKNVVSPSRPKKTPHQGKRRSGKVKSKELVAERSSSKGNRKRISEMTPEEAERERARWRAKGEKEKEQRRRAAEGDEIMAEGNATSPGKRKRLRICEMSPEQAGRERARLRAKREREKERREQTVKNYVWEQSDASCIKTPGKRKKRVADMTPEELKVYREKERERSRKRREREKNICDPEKRKQFEERYAAKLEKLKLKRALAKEGALPKEDLARIEEQKRKDRERRQAKRAAMSLEERREELQRNKLYKLNLMARLSEEEIAARRMRKYMETQARLAEMDPETRKAYHEKQRVRNREAARRKAARLRSNPKVRDEETLKQLRERKRNYWHNMQPERKAVYLAKLRDYHKKKMEAWKETGEWDQIKERMKERNRLNSKRRRELGLNRRRKGRERVLGVKTPRKKASDLSEEEKEILRRRRREYKIRRKLAVQKLLNMGMSFEEIQQRTETPEQREHRIIRKRIQKAKSTLRKQLEGQGASDQEIQKRCEQLKQTYQPVRKFRPYKAQPDKWKPPNPEEVEKLKAEGLDNVDNLKPLSLVTNTTSSTVPKRRRRRRTSKKPQQPSQIPPQPSSPCKRAVVPVISSSTFSGVIIKREEPPTELISSSQIQTCFLLSSPIAQKQEQSQNSLPQTPNYSQTQSVTVYQIQIPSQQQLVTISCNFQQIPASISYHEANASSSAADLVNICVEDTQVGGYDNQYDINNAGSSQNDDYGNSYYEEDKKDDYSPPATPVEDEGNIAGDCSTTQTQPLDSIVEATPPPLVVETKPSGRKRAKGLKRRAGPSKPRGARKSSKSVRDVVCDECGQSYNKQYLTSHKNQMHNPNYDNQTRMCRLCGDVYTSTQRWYKHYIRDHEKFGESLAAKKSLICEECGSTFVSKCNLQKHQYFVHGEGQNKDNYIQCPQCPDKTFKGKVGYNSHLQRYHPDLLSTGFICYRCGEKFSNWILIREHVKTVHPESHFPCPYCTVTKFSQLGLYFHFRRCTKINGAERNEMRRKCEQEGNVFSLEEMRLTCEFCERLVIVSGLTRHYQEFHNVKEDKFTCSVCQKSFTTRGFWANHLEERHQWPVEDLKGMLRKLNAVNREGLTTVAKRSQYARPSESMPCARRRRKTGQTESDAGGERKRGQKSKKHKSSSGREEEIEAQEEYEKEVKQDWDSDNHNDQKKVKRKKRKITVIAEEDDMGA